MLKESTCVQKRMDREALSNDLKEMVEAVSRLIEIAFGMSQ
jgi:hypothetical protein